jgi:uncharacterized protein (DUF2062 family)
MKAIAKTVKNRLQSICEKIATIKAEPKQISLGYAFGVFLATTPLIGLKAFIALAVTHHLKWNRIAALIGVFHVNALTGPAFYGLAYLIGRAVLGSGPHSGFNGSIDIATFLQLITHNVTVLYCLLAGGAILGIPLSAGAYFFSDFLIRRHQAKQKNAEGIPGPREMKQCCEQRDRNWCRNIFVGLYRPNRYSP